MSPVQSISDPNYVKKQYQNEANLKARIRIHQEFSTNKYGWQRWLFDQLKLLPHARILELGCGAGDLWLENINRIPDGLEITLSDISIGMIERARNDLRNSSQFSQFGVVDAQSIPFDNHSFEVVIASHMLYHLPDREKALLEIRRVLKPEGRFYASTIGSNHFKELRDLVTGFDSKLEPWGGLPPASFTLESGSSQLGFYFSNVTLYRYPDSLIVTDADLLVGYLLSGRLELTAGQQAGLAEFVEQELERNNGSFYITKDSGVFEASNIGER